MNGFVADFLPSSHGFLFANDFPQAPVLSCTLPLLGEVGFGDASGGLCGGMVFAARDYFEHGKPVHLFLEAPGPDTPLFLHLCKRQVDSLNLPTGAVKYYQWMSWPDAPGGLQGRIIDKTVGNEVPLIRTGLDAGHLVPLGLVTVQSIDPRDLGQCHQVLAYGYTLQKSSGSLEISVYDPNWPGSDDRIISLNIYQPEEIIYNGEMKVRGFFRTPFVVAEPPE